MKFFKTLAFMSALIATIGCTKSDEEQIFVDQNGNNAKVTVKISRDNLRSNTDSYALSNERDQEIKNLYLLVYAGNTLVGHQFKESDKADGFAPEEFSISAECRSGKNRRIILIANMKGVFKQVDKLDPEEDMVDISNLSYDKLMKSLAKVEDYCPVDKLIPNPDWKKEHKFQPMVAEFGPCEIKGGKNILGDEAKSGETQISSEPLKLKKMLAKVRLKTLTIEENKRFTIEPELIAMALVKRFFHPVGEFEYSSENYHFIGGHGLSANLFNNKAKYMDGITYPASGSIQDGNSYIDHDVFKRKNLFDENYIDYEDRAYAVRPFYISPNTDRKHPTILYVKAKVKAADGESELDTDTKNELIEKKLIDGNSYTYYPVRINYSTKGDGTEYTGETEKSNQGVLPNFRYTLNLNIKGLGTYDPHEDKPVGTLAVICTIDNWIEMEQEDTW